MQSRFIRPVQYCGGQKSRKSSFPSMGDQLQNLTLLQISKTKIIKEVYHFLATSAKFLLDINKSLHSTIMALFTGHALVIYHLKKISRAMFQNRRGVRPMQAPPPKICVHERYNHGK